MPFSKWSSKQERTFGKKKEKWNGDFRNPPKPDCYYTKVKGQCRWCGKMILNDDGTINARKSWHEKCVNQYMLIYHSRERRAVLRRRDKGKCAKCNKFSRKWDVDHIRPLIEQKNLKEEELDYTYYSLDNLQTLCKKCHREKSNSEVPLKKKTKFHNNFFGRTKKTRYDV